MNQPSFRPLGDRYLILPDEQKAEETQVGEYTISREKDHRNPPASGIVVRRGKSCVELEVGDRAAYGKYSGYDQMVDGTLYKVLRESEMLGQLVKPYDPNKEHRFTCNGCGRTFDCCWPAPELCDACDPTKAPLPAGPSSPPVGASVPVPEAAVFKEVVATLRSGICVNCRLRKTADHGLFCESCDPFRHLT